MKLSIAFAETRLSQLGSRCEPVTSTVDRKGYKPRGEFLHRAGLSLFKVNAEGDFVEFRMIEKSGPDSLAIRDFSYSREELESGIDLLLGDMAADRNEYATEWNWLQFSLARALLDESGPNAQIALMRSQAASAPMRVGFVDNDEPFRPDLS